MKKLNFVLVSITIFLYRVATDQILGYRTIHGNRIIEKIKNIPPTYRTIYRTKMEIYSKNTEQFTGIELQKKYRISHTHTEPFTEMTTSAQMVRYYQTNYRTKWAGFDILNHGLIYRTRPILFCN